MRREVVPIPRRLNVPRVIPEQLSEPGSETWERFRKKTREGHHDVEALRLEIPGSGSAGLHGPAAPRGVTPETHPAPMFQVHVSPRDCQRHCKWPFFPMLQPPACPPDPEKVLANGRGLQKASGLCLRKGKNTHVSTSPAGWPAAEEAGAALWWLNGRHAGARFAAGGCRASTETLDRVRGLGGRVRLPVRAGCLTVRVITPGSNYRGLRQSF